MFKSIISKFTPDPIFKGYDINTEYPCSPMTLSKNFTKLMYLIINLVDIEIIINYILQHPNEINKKNEKGWTALMIACRNSNIYGNDIVDILLGNNADPNLCNNKSWTALTLACVHSGYDSNCDTVKLLLENNADINICVDEIFLLHQVILSKYCNHIGVIELLFTFGANLHQKYGNNDNTLLMCLCFNLNITNKIEIAKLLLDKINNINYTNNHGHTALIFACGNMCRINNYALIEYLIENDANVNQMNNNHETALMYLCKRLDVENIIDVITLLLHKGVDINAQHKYGSTALYCACMNFDENNDINVIEFLLKMGANPNVIINTKDNNYMSLLTHMSIKPHVENVIELLIKYGANVNFQNARGSTLLMFAITKPVFNNTKILLKNNVDVNVIDNIGYTALMLLCADVCQDEIQILRLLLEYGADVNMRSHNGKTCVNFIKRRKEKIKKFYNNAGKLNHLDIMLNMLKYEQIRQMNKILIADKQKHDNVVQINFVDIENNVKSECCVCMNEIIDVCMLIPCGHENTCMNCIDGLYEKICPICNQKFLKVAKIVK